MMPRPALLALGLLAAPLAAQAPVTPRDSALHVLNRLAFGATPGLADRIAREGVMKWIDRQLAVEEADDPGLRGVLARFDLLSASPDELLESYVRVQQARRMERRDAAADSADAMMSPEERQRRLPPEARELRSMVMQLPQIVMVRAVGSDHQLAEVMADFWSNHFNVFQGKNLDRVYLPSYIEQTIRPRLFGRFEDLLLATAESPAMMVYLDNAESIMPGARPDQRDRRNAADRIRARGGLRGRPGIGGRPGRPGLGGRPGVGGLPGGGGRPGRLDPGRDPMMGDSLDAVRRQIQQRRPTGLNENYARELMELHTLGVDGGYTQHDVTEVARILTGWSVERPIAGAGFVFNDWAHDRGKKTVLGVEFPSGRGQDEGRKLLGMLADNPSTAHYISGKLCARFVSDVPTDGCIDHAVAAWKRSGGEIRTVLSAIFHSPDFWAPANRSAKVKSPLEFVVSAVRALGGIPDTTPRLAGAVGRLGQPLFQHVAPNGYPEHEEDWVNSGALLGRMNFAMQLAANRLPGVSVNLDQVIPVTDDHAALVDGVDRLILGGRMSAQTRKVLNEQLADVRDPVQARALAVGLALGGPEFQRQ